jgi:hypothetical protein
VERIPLTIDAHRDPALRPLLVILEAEIVIDRRLEVVEHVDPGVEFLGVSRLDQDIAVGIIEPGKHDRAAGSSLELNDQRVVQGGDHPDVGILEIARHRLIQPAELVAQLLAHRRGQCVRRPEPERDHGGLGHHRHRCSRRQILEGVGVLGSLPGHSGATPCLDHESESHESPLESHQHRVMSHES